MCFPPQQVARITNCCKSNTITVALPWKPTCMYITVAELLIKQWHRYDFWLSCNFCLKYFVIKQPYLIWQKHIMWPWHRKENSSWSTWTWFLSLESARLTGKNVKFSFICVCLDRAISDNSPDMIRCVIEHQDTLSLFLIIMYILVDLQNKRPY